MPRTQYVKHFPGACSWQFCLAIAMLLISSHVAAQSATPASNSNFSSLEQWIALQEDLREHIDRTFIDIDAALDANNFEAESLTRFVRHEVAFQQYPGVMRGAKGTLQTRAGNSLDQSLLLVTLLRDAGYDARIAHASISREAASTLLGEMARIPETPQVYTEGASEVLFRIAEFLEAQSSTSEPPAGEWETELEERRGMIGDLSAAITGALANNGVAIDPAGVHSSIVEEARSYYWCQYRDGPSSKWVNAHPAFDDTPSVFTNLQPENFLQDEVPEELLQHITFQLFAKRRIGSSIETAELTQPWTRPVANLHGIPIVLSLVPSQFSRITEEDYDASSDLFLPYLNESLAPGANAFDLNGSIVPADVALSNMAGVFKTVSDKGISAATALQSLGSSGQDEQEAAMALEDVWLEISLSGPGINPDRQWRRSFNSDGSADGPTAHSLSRKVVINLAAGRPSPAKSYDQSLHMHIEALKLTINQQRASEADALHNLIDKDSAQYEIDRTALEGIGDFTSYLALLAPNTDSSVSFRHQPLIVAKHYSLFPDSSEPEGLDIINNARRSFAFSIDQPPQFDPRATLDHGIAESMTEYAVLEWEYGTSTNAVTEYQPVLKGASPIVFTSQSDPGAQAGEHSLARQRMEASVREGRVVVSPPRREDGEDVKAWWEVDPVTGETIGRTRNGWGGSYLALATSTEDIITRKIVIGVTCMMVVQSSCRMYSRTAIAAIAVAISGTGYVGCKAFFLVGPGSNLPPGIPDPCDEIKKGHTYVVRALRGVENWLYEYCYKRALPECLKAAASG